MTHVETQMAAGLRTQMPSQYEMAFSHFGRSLDQDWHLTRAFQAGELMIRLEMRTTADPGDVVNASQRLRNESYHFSTNLTHVHSKHV